WYPSGRRTFHPGAADATQAAATVDAIRAFTRRPRPRILIEREAGAHDLALAEAIAEARQCIETGEEKVILTALCGHGHLDLAAYDAYLSGAMTDRSWDDAEIQASVAAALERLPVV
ncbi:MAG: tryptophan synthase beta chain, partial [Kribbellaceae bacterium]|nr:tryptophan synthase beta chain [Kribbellaceae bacterium]